MMYKYFLIPAVLSCASLLMTADLAQAQRGGHGGGGHGGGHAAVHTGGFHNGGFHNGGFHNGGFHNGSRTFVGVGFYGGGYWGGGYYYPYSYAYDPYPYYYAPRVSYYVPPLALDVAPAAPAVAANAANIRVFVPDPQAKIWFDGSLTKQEGTDRLFHTPTLSAGGTYSYRIRAAWTQNGKEMIQEQVASVTVGQTTVVDFTKPFSEPVPAPK